MPVASVAGQKTPVEAERGQFLVELPAEIISKIFARQDVLSGALKVLEGENAQQGYFVTWAQLSGRLYEDISKGRGPGVKMSLS